jgi:hypothetical protein
MGPANNVLGGFEAPAVDPALGVASEGRGLSGRRRRKVLGAADGPGRKVGMFLQKALSNAVSCELLRHVCRKWGPPIITSLIGRSVLFAKRLR